MKNEILIPEKISFLFKKQERILSSLLVSFVLVSTIKNDYSLGFYLTDKNGEILLWRKDILKSISEYQQSFPMDYSGGIDDCSLLVVSVESKSILKKRSKLLKEFYPEEYRDLRAKINICNNSNYSGEKKIKMNELNDNYLCNI